VDILGSIIRTTTNISWNNGLWRFLVVIILVWGFNFILWGTIGLIRVFTEKISRLLLSRKKQLAVKNKFKNEEVAVMVPAHNEELVIADTLKSLLKLLDPSNIFIVSDGSKDRTGEIARGYGVNVLELNPGKGKAGALETCIKHFKIDRYYKAVILVDADTRLKSDYLEYALPFFNDPKVVAVAGYASTIWEPNNLSWKQILFILHRDRVYFLTQRLVKFGQTWKYTSVTPIVPGFASIYRTSILKHVTMDPPGLVIEDFNMTFEVHHKNLGRIAHHPSVVGYTQDPDNAKDYFRQIKRWHLGFWQTIRFHGFWPSKFWAALILTLIETILGSLIFLLIPIFLLLSLVPASLLPFSSWPSYCEWHYLIMTSFVVIWISDYLLTIITAIFQKRKEYLVVGIFFPLIRFLDAVAFLSAIPRAFLVKSNGQWTSPTRRLR
jgi:cellulose synthase/poly-beta-1,6-N-acetylglucosamine synthase-like glycosyltransferase